MNTRLHILLSFVFSIVFAVAAVAQAPKRMTSADIYEAMQKLNFLGSALYVAAHPDDENTRMISYLANEVKANTAYLSITRGDGGQNLIGTEMSELLGLLRTQELLGARRIDGGWQLFTRANDFGYSKHPDETFQIWGREAISSDVVWAIRQWQPDIIINRFDHRSAGTTHGHHTASAVLSFELFEKTADRNAFPEQLAHVSPWQPRRLFFNTSWWFFRSRENFEKADKSNFISMDLGVFYPMKGKSNTEMAAESRSMHRCQGFGSVGTRGSELEYLELLKGDMPADRSNPFDGINTTWTRLSGGEPIGRLLADVEKEYRFDRPYASLPKLLQAYRLIQALPAGYWKGVKQQEIEAVIAACTGLFAEAVAADFSATPGGDIALNIEIINRSPVAMELRGIRSFPAGADTVLQHPLADNERFLTKKTLRIPADFPNSNAYWLNTPWETGLYTVEDQRLRGLPETPRLAKVQFDLLIEGQPFVWETEVVHKKGDPAKGEVYQPFEITPPVFANIREGVYVFAGQEPKTIELTLKSGAPNVEGVVEWELPSGWRMEPTSKSFQLQLKSEEQTLRFSLFPPAGESEGYLSPKVTVGGKAYNQEIVTIAYDHIPTQTVLRRSRAKIAMIDLRKAGAEIGYIMGAGDEAPAGLRQIGYTVTELKDADITPETLRRFDAVILGVRAYNTVDRLKFHQPKLMEYVEQGGNLIVQYNTTGDLVLPQDQIAPFPMKISRDRVAEEDAEVRFLLPQHPVLNVPNKITAKDFDGWVQERGLYFPGEWDKAFDAVLSLNDTGETPKDGSLLVARYGSGYYVYTGLSFFRELPAGVPGAYRLLANMIALGNRAD
ncbi:MAG: PIG-L family deacetylase [Saprospiraceae bacterium]|nr:PIG-L family deacetylase [Saprospiraceae bacterium]